MTKWKDYFLSIAGMVFIIVGQYLKGMRANGGFITGLGVGILVATLLNIYPKFLNRKNETSTK
ncbi:MAG TPA: hypothetical protein VL728_08510 [Cyclobacteriaceae bacterium]|jgi:hypothetical protein|nr:hypothetical protein [Cyclobacteriaceae bacterium]